MGLSLAWVTCETAKFCLWMVRWFFSGVSHLYPTLRLTRLKMSEIILTVCKSKIILFPTLSCHSLLHYTLPYAILLHLYFLPTVQSKKKALFSCSLREQKFSNANFREENSARFCVSSRRPFFNRENSESFKKYVHSLNFCFV